MKTAGKYARFALVEFVCVLICCIAMGANPKLSWYPLLLAGLPLIIRIAWPNAPLRFRVVDFLIFGFLVTAFIGLWAAYDSGPAYQKFYLLVGAVLLYYSLSHQPTQNLWQIAIILGVFGIIPTGIYLLNASWAASPADFGIINQLGQRWMEIRPTLNFHSGFGTELFHANVVGGINAILLPISMVASIHYWHSGKKYLAGFSAFLFLLLGFGLFISSSRAGWVATVIGFLVFGLLNSQKLNGFLRKNEFILILVPAIIIILGIFAPHPLANIFTNSTIPITEVDSFNSRLRIAKQTYYLIGDFPFTGGGLGSFPGLYSQYILVIPYFLFSYSHNLYLDLALEQGLAGLALFVSITLLSANLLKSRLTQADQPQTLLVTGVYASLIIFLLHGFVGAPLYNTEWGLPLLFVIPGFSIAMADSRPKVAVSLRNQVTIILAGIAFAAVLLIAFLKPLGAIWYADIGAVQMAKLELADWPTGQWNEISNPLPYREVEESFRKALSNQADNRTANQRLGVILMAEQNFQDAASYLERSHFSAPGHRGIKKSLGYCYTWLGRFDEAKPLLVQIPEAQAEMDTYSWWWQTQGRDDLAGNAAIMSKLLSRP